LSLGGVCLRVKVLAGRPKLTYHPPTSLTQPLEATLRYLLCIILLLPFTSYGAGNLRILLTNDDGYDSPGIMALHKALKNAGHTVYLIAPATQQSGASASITAGGVKVTTHPDQVWAVHGRPADAVRVGLGYILYNNPPDLVVSGANFGQNTGQEVNISGTVGAAITAFRLGVPSIAVSVGINFEEREQGFPSTIGAFSGAARMVTRLIDNMDLDDMTAVLNVNYPAVLPLDVRGVRWSQLSDHSLLAKRYNLQKDGSYAPELQGPHPNARMHDAESLINGYVTLTFLDGDMSTPTARSQKYLSQYLLDRSYETEDVEPEVRRKPEPVTRPSTPANPKTTASKPPEPILSGRKPIDASIKLDNKQPARSATTPYVPGDSVVTPVVEPKVQQTAPETAPPESSILVPVPAESQEEPDQEIKSAPTTRKKPDSWLRRMFDPGSWRN